MGPVLGTGGLICPISGTSRGDDGEEAHSPMEGAVPWPIKWGRWGPTLPHSPDLKKRVPGPSIPNTTTHEPLREGLTTSKSPDPKAWEEAGAGRNVSLVRLLSLHTVKGHQLPLLLLLPSLSLPHHDLSRLRGCGVF